MEKDTKHNRRKETHGNEKNGGESERLTGGEGEHMGVHRLNIGVCVCVCVCVCVDGRESNESDGPWRNNIEREDAGVCII
jgi:hypothetical protein